MKNFLTTLLCILLFFVVLYPQVRIDKEPLPESHQAKTLINLQHSAVNSLLLRQHKEALQFNYQMGGFKSRFDKQEGSFNRLTKFNVSDNKILINKKQLENGFLLTQVISQYWFDSVLTSSGRISYKYDGNNNLIGELRQIWIDNTWVDSKKLTYTYDENNNLIKELWQDWIDYAWVNSQMYSYTYNSNYNLNEILYQDSDYRNHNIWVNDTKTSYKYDLNNNPIVELIQYRNNNDWANEKISYYGYDDNNNIFAIEGHIWVNDWWAINNWNSFFYDSDKRLIEEILAIWNNYSWHNTNMYSYTYDSSNNLIKELQQGWTDNAWDAYAELSYTYDEHNNLIEELWQDLTGYERPSKIKRLYSYASVTAINSDFTLPDSYSLSNNYPNPFNPSTQISYTIPKRSIVRLKVFDVLGREVAELVNEEKEAGRYKVSFSASSIASGVYLYRMQAGDFIQIKKMIFQK